MAPTPHLLPDRSHGMRQCLRAAADFPLSSDCHPDDRDLLEAFRRLCQGHGLTDQDRRTLAEAATRGALFIVTRGNGDTLDRLADLKRRRR